MLSWGCASGRFGPTAVPIAYLKVFLLAGDRRGSRWMVRWERKKTRSPLLPMAGMIPPFLPMAHASSVLGRVRCGFFFPPLFQLGREGKLLQAACAKHPLNQKWCKLRVVQGRP